MDSMPQEHLRVINLHNHPSGDPSPSPEDVALTRSIVQAGKLLDNEHKGIFSKCVIVHHIINAMKLRVLRTSLFVPFFPGLSAY